MRRGLGGSDIKSILNLQVQDVLQAYSVCMCAGVCVCLETDNDTYKKIHLYSGAGFGSGWEGTFTDPDDLKILPDLIDAGLLKRRSPCLPLS